MKISLDSGWRILQDVHDAGERLELYRQEFSITDKGHQISEWEPIDRLEHLQLLLTEQPYWGRELRYFNHAPWWYSTSFVLPTDGTRIRLGFTNVDYYAKVWLNGVLLGEHEGYSAGFSFDVKGIAVHDRPNYLAVKVWSPWDSSVQDDMDSMRTYRVTRDMVKGTYEHGDTLIARDLNPVGIYGEVTVEVESGAGFGRRPAVDYTLHDDQSAEVRVSLELVDAHDAEASVSLRHLSTGRVVGSEARRVDGATSEMQLAMRIKDVHLWNTWDVGDPELYEVSIRVGTNTYSTRIGFRSLAMIRDAETTQILLNSRPFYVRGTSYFPDAYISAMTEERYLRDLLALKAAGFNLIRVHVHVELPALYRLCDELGIAIMQDSEFNWTHPTTTEWAARLTRIFLETMDELRDHPSILTWIALNEPGALDDSARDGGPAMEVSPGPELFDAIVRADPTRTVIKGSFCEDDPDSGDSHNYIGSLQGEDMNYTGIDGSVEKLNTEFGFDAPGILRNLRTQPAIASRLASLLPAMPDLQDYQYRLTKYYIEHYRGQKAQPNWGYVQFMFIDLSPQSFYGVHDWWGTPKPAFTALLESNQPRLVMIQRTAQRLRSILVVNDTTEPLENVSVSWRIASAGHVIHEGSVLVDVPENGRLTIQELDVDAASGASEADLAIRSASGRLIARNHYSQLFLHPAHIAGHPGRMSHELGMRLYSA